MSEKFPRLNPPSGEASDYRITYESILRAVVAPKREVVSLAQEIDLSEVEQILNELG